MVCFRDYEITRGYKLWTAWGFRWLETPRAFITSPRTMCRLFQPSYQKDCLRDFRAKGFLHLWLEPNFWLVFPNSPMHHLNPNLHETPLVPWSFQANHASQFSLWLAGVQASASGIDQNSHLGPHHFHPNQNWYLSTRIPCPQNTAANLLRRLKHCNKLLQLVIWVGDLVTLARPDNHRQGGIPGFRISGKQNLPKKTRPHLSCHLPRIRGSSKEECHWSPKQRNKAAWTNLEPWRSPNPDLFYLLHRHSSRCRVQLELARATATLRFLESLGREIPWPAPRILCHPLLDLATTLIGVPENTERPWTWPGTHSCRGRRRGHRGRCRCFPGWRQRPVGRRRAASPGGTPFRWSWAFRGMAIRASRMWTSSGWQGQTLGSHGFTTSGWMPTNIDIDHLAVPSKCTMGCKQSTVGAWV